MSFLKPEYSDEQRAGILRGEERGKKVVPAIGGATKAVGSSIRTQVLREHAGMLKKVGAERATSIGRTASNAFGKAADTALRLAKKY